MNTFNAASAPKLLTYNPAVKNEAPVQEQQQEEAPQPITYDSTKWTGDTEGHYFTKTANFFREMKAKVGGPSEEMKSRAKTGAIAGALMGLTPALTIIGIAALPITVPMGAALGAYAGAVSA